MRTGVVSLIFAVIAVGCLSAPAQARPQGDAQSLDQILPQIREHHPGTFYDADGPFIGADGRQHYRIKWMTPEGRVVWFDADARTGRVTNADGGRGGGGGNDDRNNDRGDRNNSSNDDRRRNHLGNDESNNDNPFGNGDRRRRGDDGWPRDRDGGGHGDRGDHAPRDNNGWQDGGGRRRGHDR